MSISDADYQRWLETPGNLRCALFELTFLGNNGGAAGEFHAYIGNMPYVTDGDETPANRIFEACVLEVPSFSRRMSEQLAGRSTLSYGDLIVANDNGARNHWLRMNWDGRRVRQWLGDPSWAFADFRLVLDGVIDDVFDAGGRKIGFRIADKAALLDRPIMTTLIGGSGPNAGDVMPLALGEYMDNISPVVIDEATHTYLLSATDPDNDEILWSGGGTAYYNPVDVREDGVSMSHTPINPYFVSAVDTAANTLTSVGHGLSVNTRVRFTQWAPPNPPPAPLAYDTDYWVISEGLTADTFKLAATLGGAAIDLTGGIGFYPSFWFWGYTTDHAAGTLVIAGSPAGQITATVFGLFRGTNPAAAGERISTAGGIIEQVLTSALTDTPFTAADLDATSLAAFKSLCDQSLGVYLTERMTFTELLDALVLSVGGWWSFSRAGRLQCGRLDLPSAGTPAYSFVADDMAARSLRLVRRILPRAEIKLRAGRNWTPQEYLAASVSEYNRAKYQRAYGAEYTGAPTVTTWDTDPANHQRAAHPEAYDTCLTSGAQAEVDRLATLFQYPTGIYAFETHQAVFLLELGDLIYVESDPYTGYGIVTAIEERAKGRSAIEFFCQLPDHYPTEDIA